MTSIEGMVSVERVLRDTFFCSISDGFLLGCCLACSAHGMMDTLLMAMLMMLRSLSLTVGGSTGYSCLET